MFLVATRIYLTSAEGRTGKSTVAVGLLETLTASVARVGVFRPIVRGDVDRDYVLELLVQHASAGQSYEDCVGVDYDTIHADPDAALATIVDRFAEVEERCDAVLILGSDYTDVGTPTELSFNGRIAANLAAPVVLVTGGRPSEGDGFRTAKQCAEIARIALGELREEHAEPLAVVVNRAEPGHSDEIAERVAADTGLPAWAIAEDAELAAPLLRTVIEATDATLIRGGDPESLERPVLGTTIAAMGLPNILPRLIPGGVVIVPGDRSEVLVGTMAAQLSHTFPVLSGVILNGGFDIDPAIERLIDGLGAPLPVAATPLSTFETAVRVSQARSRLAADSPAKHARAVALFAEHVDADELVRALSLPSAGQVMTPIRFEHLLVERARAANRHIVLPEGDDDRILEAAAIVVQRRIARLTILGDPDAVRTRAAALGLELGDTHILATTDPELHERFATEYHRLRGHKGVSPEMAADTVTDVSYFGTMMVHLGLADGMVSGAKHTTAHTIRPAFEIVKTAPGGVGRVERVPDGPRRPSACVRRLRRDPRTDGRTARRHRRVVGGDGPAVRHRPAGGDAVVLDRRIRFGCRGRPGAPGDRDRDRTCARAAGGGPDPVRRRRRPLGGRLEAAGLGGGGPRDRVRVPRPEHRQ